MLFFGGPDEDRLYRDKDGTVVGRALDNGVVLDPDAPLFRKPQASTTNRGFARIRVRTGQAV